MKTNTAIIAMIVAFVAMIGMTGFAMADSTMDYDVTFVGSGTGSATISTATPVGGDYQLATWSNCDASGWQSGSYNNGAYTRIDRRTTITGLVNGAPASGAILTQVTPTSPASLPAFVQTNAAYNDDDAYGSHVKLVQGATLYDSDVPVIDDAGYEYADVDTRITGYAYDSGDASVSGSVAAVTDGSLTATTSISALVSDGDLCMRVDSLIRDETDDDETSRTDYTVRIISPHDTADGFVSGYASVNGVPQDTMKAVYVNADVTATGYFYAVTP
jgi:hypothetical protein